MSDDDLRDAENRALRRDRDYWKGRAQALAAAWAQDWLRHDTAKAVLSTENRDLVVQSVATYILSALDETRERERWSL